MTLFLSPAFQEIWKNKDPFDEVEQLQGEVFRELEARRTLRFYLNSDSFFVKIHRGIGWFEIIENLLRFRLPVLGARNEYDAIKRLEKLHIDTMKVVSFGEKGLNPAQKKSFIITEDLIQTISLEDFCLPWKNQAPNFDLKTHLISKVAYISRTLHQNGINHRDYYICHFLMHVAGSNIDTHKPDPENLKLSLIDLHRAQLRRQTPQRWLVKDIASLYFSAMDIGLTRRDFYRFMKLYNNCCLRDCLSKHLNFWQRVELQGQKLWQRKQRKGDAI